MAIGFLFLGGGTATFSTNNNAVAALLISLYPRFPTAPNDHRCHLQVPFQTFAFDFSGGSKLQNIWKIYAFVLFENVI
jgi:hypothetical protein